MYKHYNSTCILCSFLPVDMVSFLSIISCLTVVNCYLKAKIWNKDFLLANVLCTSSLIGWPQIGYNCRSEIPFFTTYYVNIRISFPKDNTFCVIVCGGPALFSEGQLYFWLMEKFLFPNVSFFHIFHFLIICYGIVRSCFWIMILICHISFAFYITFSYWHQQ